MYKRQDLLQAAGGFALVQPIDLRAQVGEQARNVLLGIEARGGAKVWGREAHSVCLLRPAKFKRTGLRNLQPRSPVENTAHMAPSAWLRPTPRTSGANAAARCGKAADFGGRATPATAEAPSVRRFPATMNGPSPDAHRLAGV